MGDLSPADVLEEAADLLLINGRCVGSRETQENRGTRSYCVLDALAAVAGIEGDAEQGIWAWSRAAESPAALALAAHLATMPDLPGYIIDSDPADIVWRWNDHFDFAPDNDFEVIDTLRRVAKDLRNES